jgi:hypothetical protein
MKAQSAEPQSVIDLVPQILHLNMSRCKRAALHNRSNGNNLLTHSSHVGCNSIERKHNTMTRTTPTLSQSGLLAVLLARQHYKAVQLARRRARFRQMRTAFLSAFRRPFSARQEPLLCEN